MSTVKISTHNPSTDVTTASTVEDSGIATALAAQMALWETYTNAAIAAKDAAAASYVNTDWANNGVTHSGMSTPATPSNIITTSTDAGTFIGCGSSTVCAVGQGIISIARSFYGRKIDVEQTKEFRWIEDTAPVVGGAFPASLGTPGFITAGGADVIAAFNAGQAALMAISGTSLANVAIIAAGQSQPLVVNISGGMTCDVFYGINGGTGLGTVTASRNISFTGAEATQHTEVAEVIGQWHQQDRFLRVVTVTNRTNVGKTSNFITTPRADIDLANPTDRGRIISKHRITVENPTVNKIFMQNLYGDQTFIESSLNAVGNEQPVVDFMFTYPGSSFLLQVGSVSLTYDNKIGAYCYDLSLKKWGKLRTDYKVLVDFSATNSYSGSLITTTDFGMDAGILNTAGDIQLFDVDPEDSWIRYGKVGFYRLGYTNIYEMRTRFRRVSNGQIDIECSVDGQNLTPGLLFSETFVNTRLLDSCPHLSARWFSIKISGNFDLTGLEFRGKVAGRR